MYVLMTTYGKCPSCKTHLRIGEDITLPCHCWCPLCQENLSFDGREFVSLGTKAYEWCSSHGFHVG
jgi:hypothetical protein